MMAWDVEAIDVDGDHDIDVLSASSDDNKIAWYENDGSENFTEHIISNNAMYAHSVYPVDIDGDNDIDVLSASHRDDKIAWYQNDGSQNFTSHTISSSADGAHSVYAIDVDGDGDIDVVGAMTGDGVNAVRWYENNGGQNYQSRQIDYVSNPRSVFLADVDNDGDLDLIAAIAGSDNVKWYENDGAANPSFTAHTVSSSVDGAMSVYAADMDNDGDIDILAAAQEEDKIYWFDSDGAVDPSF